MSSALWIGVAQVVVAGLSVVVATAVSVHVARGERIAREKGEERAARERAEERRAHGVGELFAAANLLAQAAFELDAKIEIRLRQESGIALARAAVVLDSSADGFLRWATAELGQIGEALNDRSVHPRFPRLGDQIQWKVGHFFDLGLAWLRGSLEDEVFAVLPNIDVADTVQPKPPESRGKPSVKQ